MRTVECRLGEATYDLPVNFAAIAAIEEHVGNPMELMRELVDENGVIRGVWSAAQVVEILYQGIRLSGAEVSRETVGDACVERGIFDCLPLAANYLGELVSGGPAHPPSGAAAKGKARRPKKGRHKKR